MGVYMHHLGDKLGMLTQLQLFLLEREEKLAIPSGNE